MRDILVVYSNIVPLYDEELFEKYYGLVSEQRRAKVDKQAALADKVRSLGAGYLAEHFAEDYAYSNISHSGDYSMVAFYDGMIGCDLESLGRVTEKVAKRFFCKSEALWCDTHEKATQMWTYKESFVKAVGKGLGLSFHEFEIEPFDSICYGATVLQKIVEREFVLSQIEIDSGYKAAVCYEKEQSEPRIIVKSYCLR